MKKILLAIIVAACSYSSMAQVKIGIRLAPGLGLNSVSDKDNSDGIKYSGGSSSMAFTFGPNFDFTFGDNYAFSTGLWYSMRKVNLKSEVLLLTSEYTSSMQYAQIPATFKVFTNEFVDNMKVYFQLGAIAEAKIGDKLKSSDPDLTTITGYDYEKWYQFINMGVISSVGVEYALSDNNSVFGGFFYQRGIVNQARNYKSSITDADYDFAKKAKVGLSSLGLEIGFKF